jgi:hypothetical protein
MAASWWNLVHQARHHQPEFLTLPEMNAPV